MMKKREYGDRVRKVELASFTPQVFSTTGGMGREGTEFYRRLANHLANKQDWAYAWHHYFLSSLCSHPFSATICHYVHTGK